MIARYRPHNDIFHRKVDPGPPPAALEVGQRVWDAGIPGVFGTIVAVGPEVSEVKWDSHMMNPYVANKYLRLAQEH